MKKMKKRSKIISALEVVLLEMAQEKQVPFRIEDMGLLVYIKHDNLHLEWADGFVINKPIAQIQKARH